MKLLIAILFVLNSIGAIQAQSEITDPVAESAVAQISLPNGALLIREQNVPTEIKQFSAKLFSDPKLSQGKSEVILWTDRNFRKTNASKIREQVETNLQNAGWDYQISGDEKGVTFFSAIKSLSVRHNIFGYWIMTNETLMLVMSEVFVDSPDAPIGHNSPASNQRENKNNAQLDNRTTSQNAQTFNLSASDDYVNVMGNTMPTFPTFPNVAKKPGKLRGYVKDVFGKPLQGAYIGVRSTVVGGLYSGASAETDAKGYYEIDVPWGAAHFYAAGYTIDYGEGRAAMALHPADGKTGSFASANGEVENFVLLTYGIADRDGMSEKPFYSTNYYGGAIRVEYDLNSGDMWASKGSLPQNSEVEITLTGELMDMNAVKTFVIRRKTGGINNFNINNLPIGRYKISARLTNGKQLKLRETGYNSQPLFGLKPKEATGTADLLFAPDSAKALYAQPNRGDWNAVNVKLEL